MQTFTEQIDIIIMKHGFLKVIACTMLIHKL